ncbi:MAG: hypothetical protein ACKV2Q_18570 [Planctomycetaceae bacterium]
MAKQRSLTERAAKRSAAKVPLASPAEATLAFLAFMDEFHQAYSREVNHSGWLVEEQRFPLLALHAFRRWLRREGFDVEIQKRMRASKRRSKDAIAFKFTLDKALRLAYERELHEDFGAIQFELFCRAFQAVISRYGFEVSVPRQLPERELKFIKVIDSQVAEKTWERYCVLDQQCADESLTEADQKTFLKLVEAVEGHHVKRLQAVQALSRLRRVDFFETLNDFGLGKPSDD